MATKKAGGTAKNLRDSNPKYLGTKLYEGERAFPGCIIVRQRGTRILPGKNVDMGKDHTLFSRAEGIVRFSDKKKHRFDGSVHLKKMVSVESA